MQGIGKSVRGIINKEEKVNFAKALIPDMSSEEETEDENGEPYFAWKILSR